MVTNICWHLCDQHKPCEHSYNERTTNINDMAASSHDHQHWLARDTSKSMLTIIACFGYLEGDRYQH